MAIDYNRKLSGGQMPANYHPDDAIYIDGKLSMIGYEHNGKKYGIEERGKLCSAYAKCYRDAYAAEPNEVRKDGKARREANTRLREYINKKFLRKMGQ